MATEVEMARFPYKKENIAALGRLLAEARLNADVRNALKQAPEKELAKIGLPENVTSLMNFTIVDQPDELTVAVPYKLNSDLVGQADPAYLSSIGRNFLQLN